mmetsp:Transcript_87617/g.246108  ORF Transcript_87617/g.246108 Transcript_87617/m.246108 type:complete len:285 (-) Transcript_87617:97-951(-)
MQGWSAAGARDKEHGLLSRLALVRCSASPHFNLVCTWALALVVVAAIAECTQPTAYGKFARTTEFSLPPRVGWWCMELPVSVTFLYFYFVKGGSQSGELVPRICAGLFCMHYAYRGWLYPYLLRVHPGASNSFSVLPAIGGWMVTATHGYLNAKWLAEHGKHLKRSWLRHPFFAVGVVVYLSGFVALVYHDSVMRELRPCPGGARYCIPRGGLFEYATQAVYFCELWAWLGFFLMSRGPNGAFIFLVSLANLVPRAVTSHEWYVKRFGDEYAALNRRYLVPFVW